MAQELDKLKDWVRRKLLKPGITKLHPYYHNGVGGLFEGLTEDDVALFNTVFDPYRQGPVSRSGKKVIWRSYVLLEDVLRRFQDGVNAIEQRLDPSVQGSFLPQPIVHLNKTIIPTIQANLAAIRSNVNDPLAFLSVDALLAAVVQQRWHQPSPREVEQLIAFLVQGLLKNHARYSLFIEPREINNPSFEEAFAYYLVSLWVALFESDNINYLKYFLNEKLRHLSEELRKELEAGELLLHPVGGQYASYNPLSGQTTQHEIKPIAALSDLELWLNLDHASFASMALLETIREFSTPPQSSRPKQRSGTGLKRGKAREKKVEASTFHHILFMHPDAYPINIETSPGMNLAAVYSELDCDEDDDENLITDQRSAVSDEEDAACLYIQPETPVYQYDLIADLRTRASHYIERANQLMIESLRPDEVNAILTTCENRLAKYPNLTPKECAAIILATLALTHGLDPQSDQDVRIVDHRGAVKLGEKALYLTLDTGQLFLPSLAPPLADEYNNRKAQKLVHPIAQLELPLPQRALRIIEQAATTIRKSPNYSATGSYLALRENFKSKSLHKALKILLQRTPLDPDRATPRRLGLHVVAWLLKHTKGDTWVTAQLTCQPLSLAQTQGHYTTLPAQQLYAPYRDYVEVYWKESFPVHDAGGQTAVYVGNPNRARDEALFTGLHALANRLMDRLRNDDQRQMPLPLLVDTLNLLNIYCERLIALATGLRNITNPYVYGCDIDDGWTLINDKDIHKGQNIRSVYLPRGLISLLEQFENYAHNGLKILISRKALTLASLRELKGKAGYENIPGECDGAHYLGRSGRFIGLFLLKLKHQKQPRWSVSAYTRKEANDLLQSPQCYLPRGWLRTHGIRRLDREAWMDPVFRARKDNPIRQKAEEVFNELAEIKGLKQLHLNKKGGDALTSVKTNAFRLWLRSRLSELGADPADIDHYIGHVRMGTELWHPRGMADGLMFRRAMERYIDCIFSATYPDARIGNRAPLRNPFNGNAIVSKSRNCP